MPDLIKTRVVLPLASDLNADSDPWFQPTPDDQDARLTGVRLDGDVWRDMGQPTQITVTIEPGDLLNEVRDTLAAAATMSPDELRQTLVDNDGRIPLGGVPGTTERAFNEAEGDRSE